MALFRKCTDGYSWAQFIMTHMNIPFTDTRKKMYRIVALVACILLVINIFYPLVFNSKDGVYQRGPAYSIFLFFAFFYILDSLYLYGRCRKKVGTLKLFPVRVFLVPIIFGLVVQALFCRDCHYMDIHCDRDRGNHDSTEK